MMKRFAVIMMVVLAAALLLFGTVANADIIVANGMDSSVKLATGSYVTFTVNCKGLAKGSYENYLVDLTYDANILSEPKVVSSNYPKGWTLFKGQFGKGKVTYFASDEKATNPSDKGMTLEIMFKVTGIAEKDTAFTTDVAVSGAYLKSGKYVNSTTSDSVEMVLLGGVPVNTVLADKDGSEYIVIGEKQVAFHKANPKATTKTIPDTFKKNGITFKVTEISSKAFYKNSKIRKVTIGKNVRKIGESAFEQATALTEVKGNVGLVRIEDSAFKGCRSLKTIAFGKNLKTLGASAFEGCTKLTKIILPEKVEFVGAKAFYNCKALKQVDVRTAKLTDISTVGKNAFSGTPKKMKVTIHTKKAAIYKKIKDTFLKRGVNKKAVFKQVK